MLERVTLGRRLTRLNLPFCANISPGIPLIKLRYRMALNTQVNEDMAMVERAFQGSQHDPTALGEVLPYLQRLLSTSSNGDLAAAVEVVADRSRDG